MAEPEAGVPPGLLSASVTLMAGRALGLVALAGTYVLAARALPPEEFGAVASVLALATFLLTLLDLGLNTQTQRDVAAAGNLTAYFTTLRWKTRLGLLVAVAGLVVVTVAVLLGAPGALAFAPVGPYLGVQLLLTTLVLPDLARGQVSRPARIPMIDKLAGLSATAALLLFFPSAAALPLGLLAGSILALAVARRSAPKPPRTVAPAPLADLLRAGRPYWLGGVAAQMQSLDTTLVAVIAGTVEAGYLAGPSRLAGPLTLVPAAVSTLLLSRAATRQHSAGEVLRLLLWILAVMVPLLVTLAVTAPFVVRLVLGPDFVPAVTPFRVILLALVVASLNGPLAALLQGQGHASAVGRVLAAAAVTGILAAGIGAQWGATGASWSVLVVQVIVLVGLVRMLSPGAPAAPAQEEKHA